MRETVAVEQVDREWLIAQLAAWPTRVDPDSTINIEFLMQSAAAALQSSAEQVRVLRDILFADDGTDASLNLQGALDDLTGRHDPKDGGVCARTIDRVIGQLERARATLKDTM